MINVLFLTETWWKEYAQYTHFGCFKPVARKDRVQSPRGGVAILCRTTCCSLADEIDLDNFDFAVAIALRLSEKTIALIILVYLPYPSPHEVSVECMATLLETATRSLEQKYPLSVPWHSLYVLGNFNLPNAHWHLMYSNWTRENDYLQLFYNWGLRPLILDESTHRDGNTLDNVLCNDHSYPISLQIRKQNILSDHYPIIFKVDEYLCSRSLFYEFAIFKPYELLIFQNN